jgi:hypothetical protein
MTSRVIKKLKDDAACGQIRTRARHFLVQQDDERNQQGQIACAPTATFIRPSLIMTKSGEMKKEFQNSRIPRQST